MRNLSSYLFFLSPLSATLHLSVFEETFFLIFSFFFCGNIFLFPLVPLCALVSSWHLFSLFSFFFCGNIFLRLSTTNFFLNIFCKNALVCKINPTFTAVLCRGFVRLLYSMEKVSSLFEEWLNNTVEC